MVFLEPFHQEKGNEEEKRVTNIFLSFSIFALLSDLILMANVFDLRNQIISYNSTFNESQSERKLIRKAIPYRQ
jgi:secreted Zn-dependent insulinase-like peptidase